MELRHLRYFVALAEELSFTRAAERMHITQSTLSHQIKQLEEEVGHRLFDRIGKRVIITEAGETLLPNATRALREVDEGLQAVKKSPDPLTGSLRVGTTHTFNVSLIPECLAAFLDSHPLMNVVVEELLALEVERRVEAGELDVGICHDPHKSPALTFQPLYIEELVLVVGPDHPLAGRKRVRLAELHKQRLVVANTNSLTRRVIDDALNSVHAEPVFVAEINSVPVMLGLVRRTNLGAILSRIATVDLPDLCVVALESPTPLRAPGLLTRSNVPMTPALRAFIAIVRRIVLSHS